MKIGNPVIVDFEDGLILTGEIAGTALLETLGLYIVKPDFPSQIKDEKAILVPVEIVKPLNCHWCRDTKKVNPPTFTLEEYETRTIKMIECPYCLDPKNKCATPPPKLDF